MSGWIQVNEDDIYIYYECVICDKKTHDFKYNKISGITDRWVHD